jgi:hypothetical protein
MACEWGLNFNERSDLWNHGAVGAVGYLEERPAACAVTVPLDGRWYVAPVATAHGFRRLGCACDFLYRRRRTAIQPCPEGIRKTDALVPAT